MKNKWALLASVTLLALASMANAGKSYDVLDLPAAKSELAPHALIFSLTRAGDRIIATGIRGHILYSDDFGGHWAQAEVPVRSSILDASFPTPLQGWAVGHEAVILHTIDGGKTWIKQFDGRSLGKAGVAYYEKKKEEQPDNQKFSVLLDEMHLAEEAGADRPFFKIFMRNETTGFAIGAYGIAFRTTDAGATWNPIMEFEEVDQFVHLFDYAQLENGPPITVGDQTVSADMVISGEMGTILAVDTNTQSWRPQQFPYQGSMFTILETAPDTLVTGGLRGLAFISTDRGVSWNAVTKPPTGAVVASRLLADGRVILATQEGNLLASTDHGASFTPLKVDKPQPFSDLIEGRPGELILSGERGLQIYKLAP